MSENNGFKLVILHPGEREDLRAAFCQARRASIFGLWEECGAVALEKDDYDDVADYILALDEEERILFGLRVIRKTKKMSLPIERHLADGAVAMGSVEFSRALRVRPSSPAVALSVYRALLDEYGQAPGIFASIREKYFKALPFALRLSMKRLIGHIFRKDDDVFIHVAIRADLVRRAFATAETLQHMVA